MLCNKTGRDPCEEITEYKIQLGFRELLADDMAGLHLLAYLLTADQERAELCFVAGLEGSWKDPVLGEWARSWSKLAMIKNAIKALAPLPGRHAAQRETGGEWTEDPEKNAMIAAVTRLDPFDRFVFVMMVVEAYSETDCAALLGSNAQEVREAKSRSLWCLESLREATSSAACMREVAPMWLPEPLEIA